MDKVKKYAYTICLYIFAIAMACSFAEIIDYARADYVIVSGIVMNCLNLFLFGGIFYACATKNSTALKALIVTLIAWDGTTYLVNVIPNSFVELEWAGKLWLNSAASISTFVAMCFVVLGAGIYLLGACLDKNVNFLVYIFYIIASFIMVVSLVFAGLFVALEANSLWGIAVEALLKLCIFAGCAFGLLTVDQP